MGVLAQINPAGETAAQMAKFNPAERTLDFMDQHPALASAAKHAIGIAFPPARAAAVMLEIAQTIRPMLKGGLSTASRAMSKTDARAPLMQRTGEASAYLQEQARLAQRAAPAV